MHGFLLVLAFEEVRVDSCSKLALRLSRVVHESARRNYRTENWATEFLISLPTV